MNFAAGELRQREIKIKNVHYFWKLCGDVAYLFSSVCLALCNICSKQSSPRLALEQEHLSLPPVRPHLRGRHPEDKRHHRGAVCEQTRFK